MFRRFRPSFELCARCLVSFSSRHGALTSTTTRSGRESSQPSKAEHRNELDFEPLFFLRRQHDEEKSSFCFVTFVSLTSIFPYLFFLSPPSLRELAKRAWRALSWGERKGKEGEGAPFFRLFSLAFEFLFFRAAKRRREEWGQRRKKNSLSLTRVSTSHTQKKLGPLLCWQQRLRHHAASSAGEKKACVFFRPC